MSKRTSEHEILTIIQVVAYLGVSGRTIYRLMTS